MSASICGKRLGFEEIFESSPTPSKRSRCYRMDSPIRSLDFGDDQISILFSMFPALDREYLKKVLSENGHRLEDAIGSLHALRLRDVSVLNIASSSDSVVNTRHSAVQGDDNVQKSEQKVEEIQVSGLNFEPNVPYGTSWVDIFVQEMRNASDMNDARGRTSRILEAFEKSVVAHSKASEEKEILLLRDQLQNLLRDNQILKRAVAIQHERYLEQDEKMKEVQQLKHAINQYQEQIRNLEMNVYTLKLHLQRAQDCNSHVFSRFNPDVF